MNREEVAEKLYATKELLADKRAEQKRLLSYNKRKAEKLLVEITSLEDELKKLQAALKQADEEYTSEKPRSLSEKEQLSLLLQPLNHYMRQGATALEKKRRFLIFARHPKVILAQAVYLAAQEAAKLPKKIAPLKMGALFELCSEIEAFCEELIYQANKRWNHALYVGEFLTLYSRFLKIYNRISLDR